MRDAFGIDPYEISKAKIPKKPKPMFKKKDIKNMKKLGVPKAEANFLGRQGRPTKKVDDFIEDVNYRQDFDNWIRDPNSKLTLNPNPRKPKKKG